MKHLIFSLFVFLFISLNSEINIQEIYIVSSVNDSTFSNESKIASINDDLKMGIVMKVENNDKQIYYSNSPELKINSQIINENDIQNWNELNYDDIFIKWFKVEEANGNIYDNVNPGWHWENIPYTETEMIKWRNQLKIVPDVEPTIFEPVFCDGEVIGTMRYKVKLTINGKTYSTQGKDSKHKGTISKDVHRISLKGNTNNEVINYAFAMCNLPYIWGSASFTGSNLDEHQAELFIGADCADFAVAAHQFSGYKIPYDQIKNNSYTQIITTVQSTLNNNYLDEKGDMIIVGDNGIRVGDFIYGNYDRSGIGHVGLFYKDKSDPDSVNKGNADGIFNEWDLVIHTLFHEPEIEMVGEEFSGNIRVYRIRE